jgi:hypothetical protein
MWGALLALVPRSLAALRPILQRWQRSVSFPARCAADVPRLDELGNVGNNAASHGMGACNR